MSVDDELETACSECDLIKVKTLLDRYSYLITKRFESSGKNLLQLSIIKKCNDVVQYLCSLDELEVNCVDDDGWGALHFAAGLGNVEAIRMLAKRGVDLNLQIPGVGTALHVAAADNKSNSLRVLLDIGSDPNAIERSTGFTPLHSLLDVVDNGVRAVEILLKAGANPNIKSIDGITPLEMAKSLGRAAVVELMQNPSSKTRSDFENDDIARRLGESNQEYFLRQWKSSKSGESLAWLYENFICGEGGLRSRNELEHMLGDPFHGNSESSSYSSVDGETDISLHWQDDKLIAWKKM